MARQPRRTRQNNIVIVCEGKDTEPAYLEDLKRHVNGSFDDIRIVPIESEAREAEERDAALKASSRNNSRKSRTTNAPVSSKSGRFYWIKEEEDEDSYKKYKGQPTRYLREAQLFLEDGYVEAWAVFDHDDFPDHENARNLADSDTRLNIAFSSVSFEEWLILHFERNSKAFLKSACKRGKNYIGCGDHETNDPEECHGDICVVGYLRENNLIPNYDKSKTDIFSSYTRPRLNLARINAAWIRTINAEKPIFERNPYTDFDRLVARLMNLEDQYIWIGNASDFTLNRCKVSITRISGKEIVIKNISDSPLITNWWALDSMGRQLSDSDRIQLTPGEETSIKCQGYPYIVIGDDIDKRVIIP